MSYQIILALATALNCAPIKVFNRTKTWTKDDVKVLRSAQRSCRVKYKMCLKYFVKRPEGIYHAICGIEKLDK